MQNFTTPGLGGTVSVSANTKLGFQVTGEEPDLGWLWLRVRGQIVRGGWPGPGLRGPLPNTKQLHESGVQDSRTQMLQQPGACPPGPTVP